MQIACIFYQFRTGLLNLLIIQSRQACTAAARVTLW